MNLIDGKVVSKKLREEIASEIVELKEKGIIPGLAVVIVGEDPASQSYVKSKQKACDKLGIYSEKHTLECDITEETLLNLIDQLNKNDKIHGILVQLPLPKHINDLKVIEAINPLKDVDGFHPLNVGRLSIGEDALKPCTPFGIIKLLEHYEIEIAGKHAVVLGRSNIVGKPAARLLLQENATVTICHSRTQNLEEIMKTADILVIGIGKAKFVNRSMVKDGAVIIDVGINRVETGLVGDVDFEDVKDIVSYITPVPGGVGPMTITMLMSNTLTAAKKIVFDAN